MAWGACPGERLGREVKLRRRKESSPRPEDLCLISPFDGMARCSHTGTKQLTVAL